MKIRGPIEAVICKERLVGEYHVSTNENSWPH